MKKALIAAMVSLAFAGPAVSQPWGMAPGMMGGYGMGPGMMMGGYGGNVFEGLNLNADQRKQIAQIQEETAKAHWQLMGTMHQQGYHMHGMFGPAPLDEAAARKAFQAMAEAQKAMFERSIESRKRIDAVLTQEQREQLRRHWGVR